MQAVVVKAYSLLKKLEPEGRSECTGTMVRHGCDPMTVASTMDSARLKESHEHGAHECTTRWDEDDRKYRDKHCSPTMVEP